MQSLATPFLVDGTDILDPRTVKILVTNDDGPYSRHFHETQQGLINGLDYPPLFMIPHADSSGCSSSITLKHPVLLKTTRRDTIEVYGTPADCTSIGIHTLGFMPNLIISGINRGLNIGGDLQYSGTFNTAVNALRLVNRFYPQEAVPMIFSLSSHTKEYTQEQAEYFCGLLTSGFFDKYIQTLGRCIIAINFPDKVPKKPPIVVAQSLREHKDATSPNLVRMSQGALLEVSHCDIHLDGDSGELGAIGRGLATMSFFMVDKFGFVTPKTSHILNKFGSGM